MIYFIFSIGAINALIPIIVIIILIAAAGASMRGYDIFNIFGIGALIGVSTRGSLAKRNVNRGAGANAALARGKLAAIGKRKVSEKIKNKLAKIKEVNKRTEEAMRQIAGGTAAAGATTISGKSGAGALGAGAAIISGGRTSTGTNSNNKKWAVPPEKIAKYKERKLTRLERKKARIESKIASTGKATKGQVKNLEKIEDKKINVELAANKRLTKMEMLQARKEFQQAAYRAARSGIRGTAGLALVENERQNLERAKVHYNMAKDMYKNRKNKRIVKPPEDKMDIKTRDNLRTSSADSIARRETRYKQNRSTSYESASSRMLDYEKNNKVLGIFVSGGNEKLDKKLEKYKEKRDKLESKNKGENLDDVINEERERLGKIKDKDSEEYKSAEKEARKRVRKAIEMQYDLEHNAEYKKLQGRINAIEQRKKEVRETEEKKKAENAVPPKPDKENVDKEAEEEKQKKEAEEEMKKDEEQKKRDKEAEEEMKKDEEQKK